MNPENQAFTAPKIVRDLASRGRYHFSTRELADALSVSLIAARSALRRLRNQELIASPQRGFHVIIPPEYKNIGCLPAEQFIPQLMERLAIPYYAGLLTAARYHGVSHHQPQSFQAILPKNRPDIHCGRVTIRFIARRNAEEMPTVRLNTSRGYLTVSSHETTAFDLVGYPQHCGGLDAVATILGELGEQLNADRLGAIAEQSPLPWSQRLGYLLDELGHSSLNRTLVDFVSSKAKEYVPLALSPDPEQLKKPKNSRWKLLINTELGLDL